MDPKTLINEKPGFHVMNGKPLCQSLGDATLQWMADYIAPESVTMETGYGLTTVLLLLLARRHISIAPDRSGYDRILAYCQEKNVPTAGLQYHIGFSEDVLPAMKFEAPIDFILIDGGHGFPTPFIDWAYTHIHLRVGGYLMVDDTQLATGAVLKDYLMAAPEWECEHFFHPKTALFKKKAPTSRQNWIDQPYMKQMDQQIRTLTKEYRDADAMKKLHFQPMI